MRKTRIEVSNLKNGSVVFEVVYGCDSFFLFCYGVLYLKFFYAVFCFVM